MMLTRSQSRSTSARMWLRQQHGVAALPELVDAVGEDRLHQRVEARGRLVEHAAARRRRPAPPPGRPSAGCPWSSCGPSWSGRGSNRSTSSSRRRGSSPPRSRPSRSITSPPVRFGHRLTSPGTYASRRCSAAASRHGSPPSSRTVAGVRAQQPEQHPDRRRLARRRWARGSRAPLPRRTVRSSPSSAVVAPKRLTRPCDLDRFRHAASVRLFQKFLNTAILAS